MCFRVFSCIFNGFHGISVYAVCFRVISFSGNGPDGFRAALASSDTTIPPDLDRSEGISLTIRQFQRLPEP